MVRNIKSQYKFIKYQKGLAWPYHPNRDEIEKITTPQEWAPAVTELSDFLQSGKELSLTSGTLLTKMQRIYVVTNDIHDPKKIRNRAQCRYTVTGDLLDGAGNYRLDKRTIGVRLVFDTLDEVMTQLRREWNLGYEKRVVDLWDKEKVVAAR